MSALYSGAGAEPSTLRIPGCGQLRRSIRGQRGITLFGLLFWVALLGSLLLVGLRTLPSINEYLTIQKVVSRLAREGGTTVPEIRAAFDKTRDTEYSIQSITSKDLNVTKESDRVVISFAYDKEIELIEPVFLLIKYKGRSK